MKRSYAQSGNGSRNRAETARSPAETPQPATETPPTAGAAESAVAAESWVRGHPGLSVVAAIAVGVCLGWLIKRK
jgi:ElaB/YqjD/DUF883 family membrane-anchored ribosome-binding protein